MPRFTIETAEQVHGVYSVEAASEEHARRLFDQGSIGPPSVFESVGADIESVKEEPEE